MQEIGVFGLAPGHVHKMKPQLILDRKVSAQETLLKSAKTYAMLDVKISVDVAGNSLCTRHHVSW